VPTSDIHERLVCVPTLCAKPVTMNFDQMLIAVQQGTVDGQENPIALIVPYKLWEVHKYRQKRTFKSRLAQFAC